MLDNLRLQVDRASAELLDSPPRGHLGASQIGTACIRASWYAFRWAYREKHTGRILRLFNRGHEEEDRIYRWLRATGLEVRDYTHRLVLDICGNYALLDWDEPLSEHDVDVSDSAHHIAIAKEQDVPLKQYGFEDHEGHFRGSTDGKLRFPEGFKIEGLRTIPEGWGLSECKTHNEKSFKQVKEKGVLTSKPVHYVQMQIYMHYMGLPWALYTAACKNDDALYFELVYYKPELAAQYVDMAGKLVVSPEAPKRYSNDPSWFECRFCAFREICHYDEEPARNCRSCTMAEARENASWYCKAFNQTIPPEFVKQGCDNWDPIK